MNGKVFPTILSVLRIAMGGFLLMVGIMKLGNIERLQGDIIRFDVVPEWTTLWIAYAAIGLELTVGACLVLKKLYGGATLIGAAMFAVFTGLITQAYIRGLELTCSCLGLERATTNPAFEIGWRAGLFLVMCLLCWDARRKLGMFEYGKTFGI